MRQGVGRHASAEARHGGQERNREWRSQKVSLAASDLGTAVFLLLLPAVAMRFAHEVNWTMADFVVMGALLATACATYEFAAWLNSDTAHRAAFGIASVTGFLLVWVNLAAGILGSEHNRANLMFGGVLLVLRAAR